MTEPIDFDEARSRLTPEQPPEPDPLDAFRATRSEAIKQAQEYADTVLHKAQAHAKRAAAAAALIEALDDTTDASVVLPQVAAIVDILVSSANDLVSFADLAEGWARNIDTARPDE